MIRHKLSLFVICAALATQGQVLCRWTADSSRSSQVAFDCYRGETLVFTPSLASYGTSITNYTATLLWQTNGMGNAWWSTNVLAFTPAMDVGATRYTIFIRAETTNGVNYRANGTITMRNAPGFTPNTLPLPVPVINFATVTTTNAPWLLAELDPGIPAAIDTAVAIAGTNAQTMADSALSTAVDFASTNPVYKVYAPGSSTTWIDGAGNQYGVETITNYFIQFSKPDFHEEFPYPFGYATNSFPFSLTNTWSGYFENGAAILYLRAHSTVFDDKMWTAPVGEYPLYLLSSNWPAYGTATVSRVISVVTNLVDSLSYKPSYGGATNIATASVAVHSTNETAHATLLAGKVSTTDSTYTATVAKASSALQPSATNDWTVSAHQAWLTSEADTNALTQLDAHKTNGTAHTSLFAGKVGIDRTITVNGSTGTLSSNLSFTVAAGITGATVTNIVNAFTFANQTWSAAGTNATYRMSWDVTNGTFRVEEILP
jgi:hypothetical protein